MLETSSIVNVSLVNDTTFLLYPSCSSNTYPPNSSMPVINLFAILNVHVLILDSINPLLSLTLTVKIGGIVYPLPAFIISTLTIEPFEIIGFNTAFLPTPLRLIVGKLK